MGFIADLFSSIFGVPTDSMIQFKMQQALNAQQQKYAESNQQQAFENSKALALLSPQFQKSGMKLAGISTAGLDSGGNVPVVSSASASSGGSAPNIAQNKAATIGNMLRFGEAVQGIGESVFDRKQVAKRNRADIESIVADTQGQDIDNTFKAAEKIAGINKMVSEKKLTDRQGEILKDELYISENTKDEKIRSVILDNLKTQSEISLNETQSKLNEVTALFTEAKTNLTEQQTSYVEKELSYYDKMMQKHFAKIDSDIFKNEQSGWLDQSRAWLVDTQRYAQEIANKISELKIPYLSEYAEQFKAEVQAATTKAETDIQNIVNEAKQLEFDTEHMRARFIAEQVHSYLSSFGTVIGSAFGAYAGAKGGKGGKVKPTSDPKVGQIETPPPPLYY